MATAYIDRTDTLEATEKNGVITRLVRRVRVIGLVDTDFQVLFSALEEAGIPVAGDIPAGAPNLALTERIPRLVDGEKGIVDVDLVYDHALNKGQNLDIPHYGLLVGEVRASVSQVKSNKDSSGATVTVQHTYPPEDVNFPGQTKIQGVEFDYFLPQTVLTVRGIKATSYPWLLERQLVGAVNEGDFAGRGPEEWMCVACSWAPYDGSTSRYVFTFEFQHNPDTWSPTVVFIDEITGKPPAGLLPDVGYKTISKHNLVNFEQIMGTRVQGG